MQENILSLSYKKQPYHTEKTALLIWALSRAM